MNDQHTSLCVYMFTLYYTWKYVAFLDPIRLETWHGSLMLSYMNVPWHLLECNRNCGNILYVASIVGSESQSARIMCTPSLVQVHEPHSNKLYHTCTLCMLCMCTPHATCTCIFTVPIMCITMSTHSLLAKGVFQETRLFGDFTAVEEYRTRGVHDQHKFR